MPSTDGSSRVAGRDTAGAVLTASGLTWIDLRYWCGSTGNTWWFIWTQRVCCAADIQPARCIYATEEVANIEYRDDLSIDRIARWSLYPLAGASERFG